MTDISQKKFDPERLEKAHRLMEWSNIIVIGWKTEQIALKSWKTTRSWSGT